MSNCYALFDVCYVYAMLHAVCCIFMLDGGKIISMVIYRFYI